uniref:Down syndrome cell adhesion molecule-like protein Dscam2 n=1 Tax=Strigamia maritima TaxID=126957 RepID=T1IUI6_STRMM
MVLFSPSVPDAPAQIKAALTSQESILVVWKAPLRPNGIITKYTLYMRTLHETKEWMERERAIDRCNRINCFSCPYTKETTKHTVLAGQGLNYEATNLKLGRRFDFWVTASTTVGEGQSTRVVSQTTGTKVAAQIVSFNDHVILPWKNDVTLPCKAVGAPAPDKEWLMQQTPLQTNERIRLQDDGSLFISTIQRSDAGNYSCRVQNVYGKDEITYNLVVLAPPLTPALFLSATSLTSIQVKWRSSDDGGSLIRSYNLHYKRNYGEWEEVKVDAGTDTYTLENLWCGTRYQIYLVSSNKIGASESSGILTAKTKGLAPEIPSKDKLLHENSTYIVLNLDAWTSGGCPILYFVVEYKEKEKDTWTLVSNNVKAIQDRFSILDLKPGTWYNLRVTAHNSAGSAVAQYDFFTLTSYGAATVPPMMASDQESSLSSKHKIGISIITSVLILVAAIIMVCCCRRIYRHRQQELHQEKPGENKQLQNAKFQVISQDGKPTHVEGTFPFLLTNSNEAGVRSYGSEKVSKNNPTVLQQQQDNNACPYASFRIPGYRKQEMMPQAASQYHTYSRNSLSDCKQPHSQKSPLYTKVQKQLLQHAQGMPLEQQEGKFLFLNATKVLLNYVTPGSESDLSDTEVVQYSDSFGQRQEHKPAIQMRLEHRVPDLLYHRPGSTSTDTSPDSERQSFQRPGRTRNRLKYPKPNLVAGNRSSSPESADEGTPFNFNRHMDPIHYSDAHQMDLNPSPQGYLDGGWALSSDLKCNKYNGPPLDRDEATLLVRRFQSNPSNTPLMHSHELAQDYTIAV